MQSRPRSLALDERYLQIKLTNTFAVDAHIDAHMRLIESESVGERGYCTMRDTQCELFAAISSRTRV